jgi:hypothetical protein
MQACEFKGVIIPIVPPPQIKFQSGSTRQGFLIRNLCSKAIAISQPQANRVIGNALGTQDGASKKT